MRKQRDPEPGEASGSGIDQFSDFNSTPSRRRNQEPFVARREPDRTIEGQPFWLIGSREQDTAAGGRVGIEHLVSLCATCGKPFLATGATGRPFAPARRCETHRRPGSRVKSYDVAWSVAGSGA